MGSRLLNLLTLLRTSISGSIQRHRTAEEPLLYGHREPSESVARPLIQFGGLQLQPLWQRPAFLEKGPPITLTDISAQ